MHGTRIKIALLYGVSIINGKIHNDRMLFKHQCVSYIKIMLKLLQYKKVTQICYPKHL